MADFEIVFSEGDTKAQFTLHDRETGSGNSVESGEMTISKAGSKTWIIDHVGVNDAMKGTGAAAEMVKRGVEMARERGLKIIPLCPYAKVQFKRHPDYGDVLQG